MCNKSGERSRHRLLANTDKYKQNNYVIEQTTAAHCHKVPLRQPHDRDHLDDIKKLVTTKNILKYIQVCYRVWSGFVTFRNQQAASQTREQLAQKHGVPS